MNSFLIKYKFKFVGNIELNKEQLVFSSEYNFSNDPAIYCWVLSEKQGDKPSPVAVLYVGKASFGLRKRMTQHLAGFSHSVTGSKNKEHLERAIKKKYQIHVYLRSPENYQVLGKAMNGCSIEEEFFIQAIKSNQSHKENGVLNRKRYPHN